MWRMCFWPTILFRRLADGVRVSTAKVISRTARAVPRRERHPGLVSRGHSSRRATAHSTGTSPDVRTGGDRLRAPKHPGAVSIAPLRDARKRLIRLQLQQHGLETPNASSYGLSRRPMRFGNEWELPSCPRGPQRRKPFVSAVTSFGAYSTSPTFACKRSPLQSDPGGF